MIYCSPFSFFTSVGILAHLESHLNVFLDHFCYQSLHVSYNESRLTCLKRSWFDLAGFTLFLGFIIDRVHHYLEKLNKLRSNAGASKEEVESIEKEKVELKEKEEKASKEIMQLKEQISGLSESLKKTKVECEEKDKRVETAEAHVTSLQKQAADLLLEYDRLLEENQNLQAQALRHNKN